jgi:hypothetical protein
LKYKLDFFYDPTNNASETLNKILKLFEVFPINFKNLLFKIKQSMESYEYQQIHLFECHGPEYSLERFARDKIRRMMKKIELQIDLETNFKLVNYNPN